LIIKYLASSGGTAVEHSNYDIEIKGFNPPSRYWMPGENGCLPECLPACLPFYVPASLQGYLKAFLTAC